MNPQIIAKLAIGAFSFLISVAAFKQVSEEINNRPVASTPQEPEKPKQELPVAPLPDKDKLDAKRKKDDNPDKTTED